MTPQSSNESEQQIVASVVLPSWEFKRLTHQFSDEKIKSLKKKDDDEFEHANSDKPKSSKGMMKNRAANHEPHKETELAASQEEIYSSSSISMAIKTRTVPEDDEAAVAEDSGRERLKRHRIEMGGRVWIPEMWGQEELLKDWIDCTAFDASLMNASIMSARAALAEEGRRASSGRLRIQNSC